METPCAVASDEYVGQVRDCGGTLSRRVGGIRAVQNATAQIKSGQATTFIPTPVTDT